MARSFWPQGSRNDAPSWNESIADVARYLVRHGVKARPQAVSIGHAEFALASGEIAREVGADLTVPGAMVTTVGTGFRGVMRSLLRETSLNRLISN